jgi:hypothetical protein
MSILKVRGLADFGVLADVEPYELPPGAFSFAKNVRFGNKKIEHAPVWRTASTLGTTDPRFVFTENLADDVDRILIGYKNGKVYSWSNGTETDVSKAGYTPSSVEATWTSCSLANVLFVNRSDREPWGRTPGSGVFTGITGWNAAWQAKLLRAYNGSLVALNVTKSGVNYPTLVKTSDIVTDPGVMPATWDQTDPTTDAVENPLTEMKGEIKDACVLGDDLIIYGSSQNWRMSADGSNDVYRFIQLPFDGGAINANCSVSVNGKHYVFGPNDCYVHDGLSKASVIDGKNRRFLYRTLNSSKASRCFVQYNPADETIKFCYVGGDSFTAFTGGTGCNRALVLHVPTGKQVFDDLPLVFSSSLSAVSLNSPTWATIGGTWASIGGSWQDFEDGLKKAPIYVGESNATLGLSTKLYVNDPYGEGSVVNAPVDTVATAPVYMERDGIDLDEVSEGLRSYWHVISIYPQGRLDSDSVPLEFSFGSADYFGQSPPFYSDYQTYDPRTEYKLDYDTGGRYLAMRMRYNDYKSFSLSGLDLDATVLTDGL